MTADPDEAGAYNEHGRVLADQELFDQAIQEYRQADKLWQKEASKERKRALCNWADALREQEHYEQAAEKCQEAIELDLEFPDAYDSLGRVRAAQERFDEAIEQYRLADSLWQKKGSKDRKRALCNWADALREQGHYEQAAEKCQEAIDLDPEFPAKRGTRFTRRAQPAEPFPRERHPGGHYRTHMTRQCVSTGIDHAGVGILARAPPMLASSKRSKPRGLLIALPRNIAR